MWRKPDRDVCHCHGGDMWLVHEPSREAWRLGLQLRCKSQWHAQRHEPRHANSAMHARTHTLSSLCGAQNTHAQW
eukprot:358375-Chlamydomonas_euryale.AAC.12